MENPLCKILLGKTISPTKRGEKARFFTPELSKLFFQAVCLAMILGLFFIAEATLLSNYLTPPLLKTDAAGAIVIAVPPSLESITDNVVVTLSAGQTRPALRTNCIPDGSAPVLTINIEPETGT